MGFQRSIVVKNLPANGGDAGDAGSIFLPWRKNWQPTPVFFPGRFRGLRDTLPGQSVGHLRTPLFEPAERV